MILLNLFETVLMLWHWFLGLNSLLGHLKRTWNLWLA